MGSVYKARQPRLDRLVALKILSPEKQGDAQFAERFEREARRWPGSITRVVAVYDFGECGRYTADGIRGWLDPAPVAGPRIRPKASIVPHICRRSIRTRPARTGHQAENILIDQQGRVVRLRHRQNSPDQAKNRRRPAGRSRRPTYDGSSRRRWSSGRHLLGWSSTKC
jgi:hypothetical protein